jgi:catechol 2,3-dioxygenase-like lactoylglutathione lyase family enzyme
VSKVTGIGGIFFRSADPERTRRWYRDHLGLDTDQYGTNFEWRQAEEGTDKGFTQWAPFDEDTDYFERPEQDFMINYRVEDLDGMLDRLRAGGVTIIGDVADHAYGRFVHVVDGDGRTLELWEPNDREYDKIVEGRTK